MTIKVQYNINYVEMPLNPLFDVKYVTLATCLRVIRKLQIVIWNFIILSNQIFYGVYISTVLYGLHCQLYLSCDCPQMPIVVFVVNVYR